MRCPTCGKQLPADPYFCAYCGTIIQAAPAPWPPIRLSPRSALLAVAGTAAALPPAVGCWLLAGLAARLPAASAAAVGALVAVLSGSLGAALASQVRWPLDAHPPHGDARQLALIYGVAGGLAVALGAVFVGAAVLPAGWGTATLDITAVLAGATSGFVGAAFAVPGALLVGAVAGEVLGRLARPARAPASVAPWAAALAWWLAGSSGGALVGVFVALQSNLAVAASALIGAVVQSVIQVVLFPLTTYLVRLAYLLVT